MRLLYAVPPGSFTTPASPSAMILRFSGFTLSRRLTSGSISLMRAPSGPRTLSAVVGLKSVPPLTIAAYARPSCSGVTFTSPCPIELLTA